MFSRQLTMFVSGDLSCISLVERGRYLGSCFREISFIKKNNNCIVLHCVAVQFIHPVTQYMHLGCFHYLVITNNVKMNN